MQQMKKGIAYFLLSVFTLAVIPAPLLHELFANHSDAADNHCRFYHKKLGTHLEEQQNHCAIFKADTPVYDALKINHNFTPTIVLITEYSSGELFSYSFAKSLDLPSRAPPVA